jgi:hypothetical protein
MADSKYNVSISGGTIGAMAVGPGVKAEGSVTIGGKKEPTGTRLRATVDVRGALSRANMASMLEAAALSIREGEDTGAIGRITGDKPAGIAWKVEVDP